MAQTPECSRMPLFRPATAHPDYPQISSAPLDPPRSLFRLNLKCYTLQSLSIHNNGSNLSSGPFR